MATNPGPGYYYNDKAERVRKSICLVIQELFNKRKENKHNSKQQMQLNPK